MAGLVLMACKSLLTYLPPVSLNIQQATYTLVQQFGTCIIIIHPHLAAQLSQLNSLSMYTKGQFLVLLLLHLQHTEVYTRSLRPHLELYRCSQLILQALAQQTTQKQSSV